jgi:hypothetical protein
MLCDPCASADVVKLAWPPLNVALPIMVEPSLKFTFPVGVPNEELTIVVNVTDCATFDGLTDEVSAEVVFKRFTVWLNTGDVLVEKLAFPM